MFAKIKNEKYYPNQTRVIKKFLFSPMSIFDEYGFVTRKWLCFAKIRQVFRINQKLKNDIYFQWETLEFVN